MAKVMGKKNEQIMNMASYQLDYKFYEKPTTTNATIRENSAIRENPKIQSLSNDLMRRPLITKTELPKNCRAEVVDRYGVKLMTSGFTREQAKKILA